MPAVTLTNEQAVTLLAQLPPRQSLSVLLTMAERSQRLRVSRMQAREDVLRNVAGARGKQWDTLTDDERIALVDDVLHEDKRNIRG